MLVASFVPCISLLVYRVNNTASSTMARQKSSTLPSGNEKTGSRDPMLNSPTNHRKHTLREQYAKGPLAWNVRKADQAPVRLAIKNHFVAMVGEFVGTTLFLLLALGATNVANIPTTSVTGATAEGEKGTTVAAVNTSSLLYIALAFGFSLAVNAWIFFRVSGGLFNPAVSFGMALVGALTPLRACLLTFAQILGGITGMSRRTRIPRVTHTGRSNRRRYRRCYHSGNVECSNTIGRRNNCGQRTVYRNVHDVDAHDYHVSICMRRILCPILISTPIVVCCLLLKSTRQPSSRQLVSGELPITWTVTQLTHIVGRI
jgi:hypothetical protein